MRRFIIILVVLASWLAGCASTSWKSVRDQDTITGYRLYLREHQRSDHASEARERLAYLELRRRPAMDGYERFRAEYPESELLPELDALFEQRLFDAARAAGSAGAYASFLERFPDGALAPRARGNLAYLQAGGFPGRAAQLEEFARTHPESDFAAEALRTGQALSAQSQSRLRRIGLRIEIASALPDANRLVKTFADRALQAYASAGVELVPVTGATPPSLDGVLSIRHEEQSVPTEVSDGRVTPPGIVASTRVTLGRGDDEPIWDETFRFRAATSERRSDGSVLFSARAPKYWREFFVPVATWSTDAARRPAIALRSGLTGVDADAGNALALFGDGSFRALDLADPASPRATLEYERPPDLARFQGVVRRGSQVVLFGEDGVELVSLTGGAAQRVRAIDRARAGAVAAVVFHGPDLLIAGSRGLLLARAADEQVETLLARPLRALQRDGDRLYALDGEFLYAGSRDGRGLQPVMRIERTVGSEALRVSDGLAVLLGERSVTCFDLSNLAAPRQLVRLRSIDVGEVRDAVVVGARVFLLGARGLQVLDPYRGRVVDSVDVESSTALAVAGRHLVLAGGDRVQVVDTSPWTAGRQPAKQGRVRER